MADIEKLIEAANTVVQGDEKVSVEKLLCYGENIVRYEPERKKEFSKEKIYQQIEEELNSEKLYLMIFDESEIEEEEIPKTFVCVTTAIGSIFIDNNFELEKQLIKAGMEVQLEAPIAIDYYEGKTKMSYKKTILMEVIANMNAIEDKEYELLWKRAKETSRWPLQNSFRLELQFWERLDNQLVVSKVKRLERQWEEAADVLLSAFVNLYFDNIKDFPEETWEDLYSKLPEKNRQIFEAAVRNTFKIGYAYHSTIYHSFKEKMKIVLLIWRLFQKNGSEEELRKSVVKMIHMILNDYIKDEDNYSFEEFFSELFTSITDFGEISLAERDESVRLLLKYKDASLSIWKKILATDFVFMECMDFYIEQVRQGDNKIVLPLLLSAKFKEPTEEDRK